MVIVEGPLDEPHPGVDLAQLDLGLEHVGADLSDDVMDEHHDLASLGLPPFGGEQSSFRVPQKGPGVNLLGPSRGSRCRGQPGST